MDRCHCFGGWTGDVCSVRQCEPCVHGTCNDGMYALAQVPKISNGCRRPCPSPPAQACAYALPGGLASAATTLRVPWHARGVEHASTAAVHVQMGGVAQTARWGHAHSAALHMAAAQQAAANATTVSVVRAVMSQLAPMTAPTEGCATRGSATAMHHMVAQIAASCTATCVAAGICLRLQPRAVSLDGPSLPWALPPLPPPSATPAPSLPS